MYTCGYLSLSLMPSAAPRAAGLSEDRRALRRTLDMRVWVMEEVRAVNAPWGYIC